MRISRLILSLGLSAALFLLSTLALQAGTEVAQQSGVGQSSRQAVPTPATSHVPFDPERPLPPTASDLPHLPPSPLPSTRRTVTVPLQPDLDVLWISRQPRYQRYCVQYPNDLPTLCAGTVGVQRQPHPGEPVTFTGHIANRGFAHSGSFTFTWEVDAQPLLSGTLPGLAPDEEITTTLNWSWAAEPHTVTLRVEPDEPAAEICAANNQRSDRTDALFLEVLVHPLVYDAFSSRRNLVGSYSFEDWIQAQFAAMNERLSTAVYPETPLGVLDRVRVDVITVTADVGSDIVSSTLPYDGRWTFRVDKDDHHTPQDESSESAENYAARFAANLDWGLIHELTHQLGVIDLYWFNVFSGDENLVLDLEGLPLLSGFTWPRPGLMGGGWRPDDRDGTHYSRHTARALNQHDHFRRGYFGEYLYDLPQRIVLQVLDNRGQPLPAATVALYQSERNVVDGTPEIVGTTDAQGRFELPDRLLPHGGTTTATGHTLQSSPFGHIDVVGRNGQFLVQVAREWQEFYTWWRIVDFNHAAWAGATTYTRTLHTHLPPSDAPAPPPALHGLLDGWRPTLWWEPSPNHDVVAYNVYRGDGPQFYPFRRIITHTAALHTDEATLWGTVRYAVTAVDSTGRESGFSPVFRAPRLVAPVAVQFDEHGRRIVLDGHNGALITQLADGRWVGHQGWQHLGLIGAQALARGSEGQMAAAVTGNDRVTIVDADRRLINWFGRHDFVTGSLDGPSGVAFLGPAFTVAHPLDDDAATGLLAHYDNSLASTNGQQPTAAAGIAFAPGRFGQGVLMSEGSWLRYAAANRFDPHAGSVELWVQPNWPPNDGQTHLFFEAGDGSEEPGYRLRLAKSGEWPGIHAHVTDFGRHDETVYAGIGGWQAGEWHHLAVTWDDHRLALFVDGRLQDARPLHHAITGTVTTLAVGGTLSGTLPAEAVLDELRISRFPRLGNSDQVRLFVAEAEASRLQVFDLLGNPISSFGEPGTGDAQFAQPHGLLSMAFDEPFDAAHGELLVADSSNDRLVRLGFDGQTLTFRGVIGEGILRWPCSLALGPEGEIVVADAGNDRVVVLDAQGDLLAAFTRGNDGHEGHFRSPRGVAVGPQGEIVVADTGNQRVVTIWHALGWNRRYLPVVLGK